MSRYGEVGDVPSPGLSMVLFATSWVMTVSLCSGSASCLPGLAIPLVLSLHPDLHWSPAPSVEAGWSPHTAGASYWRWWRLGEPRLFGEIGPDESQAGNLVAEPSTDFSVILVLLDVLWRNIWNTVLLSTQINLFFKIYLTCKKYLPNHFYLVILTRSKLGSQ